MAWQLHEPNAIALPELGHLERKGFALDLLQGKSIEQIARAILDVFAETPTLQNEMRSKLALDLNVLENGTVDNKRIRITLILNGFYGHGVDDRLLSLLAAKLTEK